MTTRAAMSERVRTPNMASLHRGRASRRPSTATPFASTVRVRFLLCVPPLVLQIGSDGQRIARPGLETGVLVRVLARDLVAREERLRLRSVLQNARHGRIL